ncbi:hypothetical protein [Aestuariispira insulae]|uniref:Uncharacterized protein n=1 Tax=Aestuariispira insulae TaxID=1461337 RepID=A0A3D9H9R6_9PROT|nr:hypothetical protein [Aestuariispira insulae]RED46233.1 hypothetical protein DFP90_110143 [Aestuariispira insulae]
MTVAYSPPVEPRFGAEAVRVCLDAALQQEQQNGRWNGILKQEGLDEHADAHSYEIDLVKNGKKWSPIQKSRARLRGKGHSSNFRLHVGYLERGDFDMPLDGIPFTVVLTIRDNEGVAPVYNDARQSLISLTQAELQDITIAQQLRVRP